MAESVEHSTTPVMRVNPFVDLIAVSAENTSPKNEFYPPAFLLALEKILEGYGSGIHSVNWSTDRLVLDTHGDLSSRTHLLSRIEEEYLRHRYGLVPASGLANDYSDAAILQAFHRVHPEMTDALVRFSPTVTSPLLALWTGAAQVFLKDDSEQVVGSFKIRGATNFLVWHLEEGRDPEKYLVIAASHGNHAQGVVRAAKNLGYAKTLLVLPAHKQTQKIKIRQCLAQGAFLILQGNRLQAAMELAKEITLGGLKRTIHDNTIYFDETATDEAIDRAIASGKMIVLSPRDGGPVTDLFQLQRLFVPTYDDARIAMGQGTSAMELFGEYPHLMQSALVYFVAAGGGGKISGDGTVIRRFNKNAGTRIIGVNDEGVPVLVRSLEKKRLALDKKEIEAPEVNRFADGSDVPELGEITFKQIMEIGAEAKLVTPQEIAEALVFADSQPWYKDSPKRIEGAVAASLAGLLNGVAENPKPWHKQAQEGSTQGALDGREVVLAITGKNIDEATLRRAYLQAGWVAHHPEFYRFITEIRRTIRAHESQPREWIGILEELIQSPNQREALICIFQQTRREDLSKEVLSYVYQRRAQLQALKENGVVSQEEWLRIVTVTQSIVPMVRSTFERRADGSRPVLIFTRQFADLLESRFLSRTDVKDVLKYLQIAEKQYRQFGPKEVNRIHEALAIFKTIDQQGQIPITLDHVLQSLNTLNEIPHEKDAAFERARKDAMASLKMGHFPSPSVIWALQNDLAERRKSLRDHPNMKHASGTLYLLDQVILDVDRIAHIPRVKALFGPYQDGGEGSGAQDPEVAQGWRSLVTGFLTKNGHSDEAVFLGALWSLDDPRLDRKLYPYIPRLKGILETALKDPTIRSDEKFSREIRWAMRALGSMRYDLYRARARFLLEHGLPTPDLKPIEIPEQVRPDRERRGVFRPDGIPTEDEFPVLPQTIGNPMAHGGGGQSRPVYVRNPARFGPTSLFARKATLRFLRLH